MVGTEQIMHILVGWNIVMDTQKVITAFIKIVDYNFVVIISLVYTQDTAGDFIYTLLVKQYLKIQLN